MNITLFGATGTIGQRILREALNRGHNVTAVVRDPSKLSERHANLRVVKGDVFNATSIAEISTGTDVIVSAYGSGSADPSTVVDAVRALAEGTKQAGAKRLIVVGGAGGLEVAPGVQLVDTPDFPAAWKGVALAHRDAHNVLKKSDVDWTAFSPAALIEPGERTGVFRTGTDQLLVDDSGVSRISTEDYAVALVNEIEEPSHIRGRFTVAY